MVPDSFGLRTQTLRMFPCKNNPGPVEQSNQVVRRDRLKTTPPMQSPCRQGLRRLRLSRLCCQGCGSCRGCGCRACRCGGCGCGGCGCGCAPYVYGPSYYGLYLYSPNGRFQDTFRKGY